MKKTFIFITIILLAVSIIAVSVFSQDSDNLDGNSNSGSSISGSSGSLSSGSGSGKGSSGDRTIVVTGNGKTEVTHTIMDGQGREVKIEVETEVKNGVIVKSEEKRVFMDEGGNKVVIETKAETNGNGETETEVKRKITTPSGNTITFKRETKIENGKEKITNSIKVRGAEVETELSVREEIKNGQIKIKAKLSTGVEQDIIIQPDEALQIALDELGTTNDLTFKLKEFTKNDVVKAVFLARVTRLSRLFGIFNTQANLETLVDAQTGEIIETNRPWWSFLATGVEKAIVCHVTDENEMRTINIAIPAVQAHLAHGDSIGECSEVVEEPPIPPLEIILLLDGHTFIYDNKISGRHVDNAGVTFYYNDVRELVLNSCTFAPKEPITDCPLEPRIIVNPDEVIIGDYTTIIIKPNGNKVVENRAIIGIPLEVVEPISLDDGHTFIYDSLKEGRHIDDVEVSTYYNEVREVVIDSCTLAPGESLANCNIVDYSSVLGADEVRIGRYDTIEINENGNRVIEVRAIIGVPVDEEPPIFLLGIIQLKDGHTFIYDSSKKGRHIDELGVAAYFDQVRELVIDSCTFAPDEPITDCSLGGAVSSSDLSSNTITALAVLRSPRGEKLPRDDGGFIPIGLDEEIIGFYTTLTIKENGNKVVENIAIIGEPLVTAL